MGAVLKAGLPVFVERPTLRHLCTERLTLRLFFRRRATFDSFQSRRYDCGMESVLDRLRASLYSRRLPQGGWSFLRGSVQMDLESTCLALLALRLERSASARVLLDTQCPDGSWGSFETADEASGLTGLALLTLNNLGMFADSSSRAAGRLLQTKGREASWIWKWKFRTTDTRVRFDPDKFGSPWEPGTCSWVVPTAFALLALKQTFPCCRKGKIAYRIQRSIEMLQDRACPKGGWNAGNGVVYGTPMSPHFDATAIALLALRGEPRGKLIHRSLSWLERQAGSCLSAWSLAWSILAFDAYDEPVAPVQHRLEILVEPCEKLDTTTLAVVALALDCTATGNPFEVVV